MLSDLRESGAIEQDADIVAFIYRPEYYGITAYENGESALGVGEIIVSKHRNGALDNVKLGYEAQFAKFTNIEPFGWQPPPLKPNNHFEVEKEDDNLAF
jgi:replicative DNA helicase